MLSSLVLVLFFLGLAVGSFVNVLIDRLPKEQSVVYPPSYCDHCKKKLLWYDLIPILSFLLLRGKCRYCHSPIGLGYPFVELLTGVLFVAVLLLHQQNSQLLITNSQLLITLAYYLFIASSLVVVFFTDLKYGIIPDKIVFPAILVSFVFLMSQYPNILISNVLSALGAFLFFLGIFALTHGHGMGFGDVKLSFLLGLIFSFPKIVYVLYTAFLTGAVFSIILLVLRKKGLKETIVFGPFLVAASFFILFFGEYLKTLWFLPI